MDDSCFLARIESDTKRCLLEAALGLFARQGLAATGIRNIADEAGYTNPALYRHYKSKDDLALDLFVRGYRWMSGQLLEAVAGASDMHEALSALVETWARIFDAHPDLVIYINENLHHFWPQVSEELAQRTIVTTVREVVRAADKQLSLGGDSAEELRVVALIGILSQLSRMIHLGGFDGPMATHVPELTSMLEKLLV